MRNIERLKTQRVTASRSALDVVFALDPKTSRWAQAGFTHDSNWSLWDLMGFAPEESNPKTTPEITNTTLMLATRNGLSHTKVGWEKLDTSRVTNMSALFNFSSKFNSPIGTWNTSRVRTMANMFVRADAFDQSLGSWDISRVRTMEKMFWMCGISAENLSDTLVGWARTAQSKGARRRVVLSRLPHKIYDLSEDARRSIYYLNKRFAWRIT